MPRYVTAASLHTLPGRGQARVGSLVQYMTDLVGSSQPEELDSGPLPLTISLGSPRETTLLLSGTVSSAI